MKIEGAPSQIKLKLTPPSPIKIGNLYLHKEMFCESDNRLVFLQQDSALLCNFWRHVKGNKRRKMQRREKGLRNRKESC